MTGIRNGNIPSGQGRQVGLTATELKGFGNGADPDNLAHHLAAEAPKAWFRSESGQWAQK